ASGSHKSKSGSARMIEPLIAMGEQPELLREVLIEQTDRFHADTIWRKCQSRFGKLPKTEPTANPPLAQEPLVPVKESAHRQQLPPGVEPARIYAPGSFSRSAETSETESTEFAVARGEEFHALFKSEEARATLGRIWRGKHGPAIWALMTKARE